MITVISKKDSPQAQLTDYNDYFVIDCTSQSIDKRMAHGLSPFFIGPVDCYDGLTATCVENAYQFAKVYPKMINQNGNPSEEYFAWRNEGFKKNSACRYPMGKGAIPKYSFWKVGDKYCRLDYIQARKLIYIPLYAKAVVKTEAFARLQDLMKQGYNLALSDFDGYNNDFYNMNLKDVVNNTKKTMGHAFVIKMLLDGLISVENNEVIFSEELKNM